jgi:hypothetical protein
MKRKEREKDRQQDEATPPTCSAEKWSGILVWAGISIALNFAEGFALQYC